MSKLQFTKIIAALNEKANRPCEACGVNNWSVLSDYSIFPLMSDPRVQSTDRFLPCVVVVCMNCGRTQFFNVHILGLGSELGFPEAGEALDAN
jgi:hypothetical protein